MANEYSTVDCTEVYGTAQDEKSIEGGIQASVTLQVAGADKDALMNDLLANQREYPHTADIIKPRAYHAVATPLHTDSPVSGQKYNWDTYRVSVKYSTQPDRQRYSESIEPGGEFVRLDHRFFRWSSGDPLCEGEAPGIYQPGLTLVKTYYNQPIVPPEFLSYPGKVHSAAYTSGTTGLVFPPETLLFVPGSANRSVSFGGTDGYTYTLKFVYKPQGWNKYYRPSTNTYEFIHLPNGTIWKNYPPVNMQAILDI